MALHTWIGMSLQGVTLLTLLTLIWRASAWKTKVDDRLKALEVAVRNKIRKRWF